MTPSEYVAFDTHVMRAQRNLEEAYDECANAERQANRCLIVAAVTMILCSIMVFALCSVWATVVACAFSASAFRRFWKASTKAEASVTTTARLREALWAERYAAVFRWQSDMLRVR